MAPPRAPHAPTVALVQAPVDESPGPSPHEGGPPANDVGPPPAPSPPGPLTSRRAAALAVAEALRARGHTSGTLARLWGLTPRMVRKCLAGDKALPIEKLYDLPPEACADALTAVARKRAA
jgi:hypothetical protein